ncbi:hypothetical protein UPYG_G00128950 [Umbra pygmaea]|uniref:C-type lectin domain-containing protein n=1 Tax=Umbra pygmaea TaxID=75934 RepID=A0ABD0XA45_UMBPY
MDKTVILVLLSGLLSCVTCQYQFINTAKTWSQAQVYCRDNFVDMATINSSTQMTKLLSSAPGNWKTPAWIGVNDISWWWSLNNTPLDGSTYWDVGQPDNVNSEVCVYMSNMKWSNADCNKLQHAVCYDKTSNNYILVRDPINFNILSMTWSDAKSYCRAHYTDLATVTDVTLMKVQKAILAQSYGQAGLIVWIGLNRGWTWSDQSSFSFTNWDSSEPKGAGLDCGTVQFPSGQWKSSICTNSLPFICTGAPATVQSDTQTSQYVYVSLNKTWTGAQEYCRANYVDLVTITDQTKLDQITSSLPVRWTGPSWIASYNIAWMWAFGDSALVGRGLWDVGQPDNVNKNENCVYMSNQKWSDASCDVPQHFVCYNANTKSYILARDPVNFNILSLSWRQAQLYCEEKYTELATVTDATVSIVQAVIMDQSYGQSKLIVWIGLHRGAGTLQTQSCNAVDFPSKRWIGVNCASTHNFICTK